MHFTGASPELYTTSRALRAAHVRHLRHAPLSRRPVLAGATDKDGKVAQVEFFANGVLSGTLRVGSTDGTYKYSLRVSLRRTTKYSLQARATDNRGARALSQIVTVTFVP